MKLLAINFLEGLQRNELHRTSEGARQGSELRLGYAIEWGALRFTYGC